MDMRRYQHFVALAEEGRFGTAAQRVHLSPAAFSRSIQALEDEMGLRLFDRGAKGAVLTPAGQVVLVRVRALLNDWRSLQHDVSLVRDGDSGEVSMGAAPIPASIVIPELLARLHRQSSCLVIRVQYGKLAKLLEQVDAHELDFCLGDPRLVGPSARFAMQRIARPQGFLYCRPDHPALCDGRMDTAAIRQCGVALISMSDTLRAGLARDYGFGDGEAFPMVCECDDLQTLVQMATRTDVLALLPQALVAQRGGHLHPLHPVLAAPTHADLHIMWLKERTLAPAALRAIALATEIGKAIDLGQAQG
ncbi:LysR family transcriptional regulator [Curvibacter sp. APW13]|uniref:LysR family transcriptional regulator n=1 Tax=Curvibacter sp. APW13 TaxID=3077236 RepID=UPI0028DD836F|nr:LysR family transcriptional regulator [Curvibacter sp. APW13]MDT8992300.1 LysR family transcriptional regulator [Curvibacter sp. APW13]